MSVYHMYIYDGTYHARSKILFMGLDLLHSQKTLKFLKGKPYPSLYSKNLSAKLSGVDLNKPTTNPVTSY